VTASKSKHKSRPVNAITPQAHNWADIDDDEEDEEVAGYADNIDDVGQVFRHHKDKWRPVAAAQREEAEKKKNQKSTAGWLLEKLGLKA